MRNAKGLWTSIVLLSLLVVLLASLLASATLRPKEPAHPAAKPPEPANRPLVIAKIGDQTLTYDDLQDQLNRKYGPELLSEMLDRKAISMEGAALGLSVNDADVDKELKRMQQGYESEEGFYRSMKEQLGLSKEELKEDTYNKLMLEKVATSKIRISDAEIDAYISAHPEEFRPRIQLHLAHIVTASKGQAEQAAEELRKGTDFELAARAYSEDKATQTHGGDIGWLDSDDPFQPEAVMNAARKLAVGAVSGVIRTDDGYQIIKLLDKKEMNKQTDRDIRDSVRKELALGEAPPLQEVVKKLREKYGAQVLDDRYK